MNNRTEYRIVARERAQATILGQPDVTVPCEVRNFSQSGMCIDVDEVILPGKIVKVEWSGNFLVGRAARSIADGNKFRIGLELLYCSQWSAPVKDLLASTEPRATA